MELAKRMEKRVCETEVELKNKHGLHMVASMRFIDTANIFKSDITVNCGAI